MDAIKARSGAIDAVRALGIAAVISGHTWGIPLVRPVFYTWHVPLFFFLAGYFWAERRTVRTEFSRRTRTLVVPYVAWYALIALVFIPADSTMEQLTPQRFFAPFLDGRQSARPYTTFWFVSALFAAVVLLRLLWRLPAWAVWATAVCGAAAGVWEGPMLARTPLSIGLALPCLIFLMAGRAARRIEARTTHRVLVGSVLLGTSAAVVAAGWSAPVDIKQGDFGTPGLSVIVACAISFALVLLGRSVLDRMPAGAHRGATFLARAGLPVVLMHPLVWWLLLTFAPGVPSWLTFLVTLTTAWCMGAVILRTRGLAWLTGGPRLRLRAVPAT